MDILRKDHFSTESAAQELTLADEANDILIKIYQHVTLGPKSLINALRNLFVAQFATIEFVSSSCSLESKQTINESRLQEGVQNNIHFGSFQLNSDTAVLPFNNDQGSYLIFQLKFLNPETCRQVITNPKVITISPHIKQALTMCIDLSQQKQDLSSTEHVLKKYPLPICVIDNHLNNIFTNHAFEKHLSDSTICTNLSSIKEIRAIARSDTNLLSYCENDKDKQLLKTALKALSSSKEETSHYLKLLINGTETPVILTTTGYVPNVFRHYARDNLVWIHLLNNDYSQALKNNERFKGLGLSKTEQELSTLLFQGHSLNDISDARNVSKQTVRKQLQSTLRKTNCESQEDLIKFLFQHCLQFCLI